MRLWYASKNGDEPIECVLCSESSDRYIFRRLVGEGETSPLYLMTKDPFKTRLFETRRKAAEFMEMECISRIQAMMDRLAEERKRQGRVQNMARLARMSRQ